MFVWRKLCQGGPEEPHLPKGRDPLQPSLSYNIQQSTRKQEKLTRKGKGSVVNIVLLN